MWRLVECDGPRWASVCRGGSEAALWGHSSAGEAGERWKKHGPPEAGHAAPRGELG